MRIGTKSVLFGAHCFFLHPWFVAAAWWKLYGFPFDPRLWVAFFVHDIGYLGKPNMDGEEGERHVELGAKIMGWLFDRRWFWFFHAPWSPRPTTWHDFSLYHSRYYAKRNCKPVSRLCFADKMSFPLTPRWLYLPAVTATGEIHEYLKNAQKADSGHWKPTGFDKRLWHEQLCEYMTKWVETHKDGAADTWTDANRHARTNSGVWKWRRVEPSMVPAIVEARLVGRKTLFEIGTAYGVTRERIRQILRGAVVDPETRARLDGADYRPTPKPKPPPKIKGRLLQRWLAECGYRYCAFGKHVQCVEDFSPRGLQCRECNAARHADWHARNLSRAQEYARKYRIANPDVQKRATARWQAKNAEYLKARYRARYERLKADPELYERLKAQWREAHRKRSTKKRAAVAA